MFCDINYFVWIKIQSDNRIIRLGTLWLFFQGYTVAVLIKFSNAVSFRVRNPIAEHCCFFLILSCFHSILKHLSKTLPVENIIPKDQTNRIIANEFLSNDK